LADTFNILSFLNKTILCHFSKLSYDLCFWYFLSV